jgi:phage terminase large subunit
MSELLLPTAEVYVPLLQPARYKAIHGGRGKGASHFFADLWLEEQMAERIDVVCLRETLKSLEFSVKKLLEAKISEHNAGAYFDIQDRRILAKRGGVTIFEGMQNHTADSIKSLEGFDRAWFAEAQRASNKSLTLLRPTIRKPGSQLWFDWNPDQPTDPIDQLLRVHKKADGTMSEPPSDSIIVQASYYDNPWFPEELRAEMEYDKARDPDKYANVWLGGYVGRSEARVFKNWKMEEFDTPANAELRNGGDFGFGADPSVGVQCYVIGRKLYIPHEVYRLACEIVDTPELFLGLPGCEKWPLICDSSRPETISHMRKHGFPKITSSLKGAGSVDEGVEWLKSYDIIIHPRCVHTIDEFSSYKYKVDKLTDTVLPILEDKKNHVIDALRYACEGVRRLVVNDSLKDFRPPQSASNPIARR